MADELADFIPAEGAFLAIWIDLLETSGVLSVLASD